MELYPIWKDFFVTLGTDEEVEYNIYTEGLDDPIYTGTSNKRPDAAENTIRINDICADYLAHTLPNISQNGIAKNIIAPRFSVEVDGDVKAEVNFTNDWSYEQDHDPSIASAPIDGVIDKRQPIIYSTYDRKTIEAKLTFEDGSTMRLPLAVGVVADFNEDFNNDFAISVNGSVSGSAVINTPEWEGLVKVSIDGFEYKVQGCARYALYYANAYGGWDTFAIRNIDKRTDALTKYTTIRDHDNGNTTNRGKANYLNEVAASWKLTTAYLTDAQSERMHHLLGSTNVYLYDMERGEMWPVVITDKSVAHLTAKNNGRQFPTYTINVELARTRIRR